MQTAESEIVYRRLQQIPEPASVIHRRWDMAKLGARHLLGTKI
ncbi:MAG TPA: hypothetical protein VG456_03415 [Candidatus Sulfopaludibacter sp.]|jgi:hypothetical protein|nr:hypothetical protein [Candidatus Sulfopaludibacter sp.]